MTDQRTLLVQQIPYLRRHARLLCGAQAVGDEYVRLCLEMVTAEPEWLDGPDFRVQVFRAFSSVWMSVNATIAETGASAGVDLPQRVEAGLRNLPDLDRQALALVVIEGFTNEQAAEILGLDAEAVKAHVREGRARLQAQISASVLIIEDEQIIAQDIARIVEDMGHRVVGMASRGSRSVQLADELKPSLVLADIKLEGEGDGITAAQSILESYDVPIVFVTGYPERLLTGEGLEPAFVVSKPFPDEALKLTIAQALATYASADAIKHRTELLAKLRTITGNNLRSAPTPVTGTGAAPMQQP